MESEIKNTTEEQPVSRAIATIEKIISLEPIKDADAIELAGVLGWFVVVKKGEFQIGDFCVYIPIDMTVDPQRECFKFLSDPKHSEKRAVIKTKKIRGVFSQGLVLPMSMLPNAENFKESDNVAQELDVQKYEKDTSTVYSGGNNVPVKPFRSDVISKTDEINLKNSPGSLEELVGKELYVTLKMDGSSMTLIYRNNGTKEEFSVCSRNYEIDEDTVMYKYVNENNLKERMQKYGRNLAIQGEFCGPKINGNKMELKTYEFYVFNVKDLDTKKFLGKDGIAQVSSDLGLKMVPILSEFVCTPEWTIKKFQEYANDQYYATKPKKIFAEGIVFRTKEAIYSPILGKCLSFKIINQNYKD